MSTLSVDTIQGKTTAGTVAMPAGAVLQVVEGTAVTAYQCFTNTSLADTGIEVNITPKFTSSNVLVFVDVQGIYHNTVNQDGKFELYRDSTELSKLSGIAGHASSGDEVTSESSVHAVFLDTAVSTTSQVTYKVRIKTASGSCCINNYTGGSNNVTRSNITVMEIAG
tara:strand:+ start:489 stop:989 length:501 start_codon:yes stop_codon:yes gene_type:complete